MADAVRHPREVKVTPLTSAHPRGESCIAESADGILMACGLPLSGEPDDPPAPPRALPPGPANDGSPARDQKYMAQQQLFLIILGVIIIGAMLGMAIVVFTDNSASSNRDALANDLLTLGARAQHYYKQPRMMGGGGRSFTGLTIDALTSKPVNDNGSYTVTTADDSALVVEGQGTERGMDGNPVAVVLTVFPDSVAVVPQN